MEVKDPLGNIYHYFRPNTNHPAGTQLELYEDTRLRTIFFPPDSYLQSTDGSELIAVKEERILTVA